MNKKTRYIVQGGIIAALYVVLTMISTAFGLSSGAIQIRISECLCILPIFTPAAIPGLFAGCVISNFLSGCIIWDVIFGSLATLIGAIFAYYLKKHPKLAPVPTVISNTVIVPLVMIFAYSIDALYPILMLTIGIGEVISAWVLGALLLFALNKTNFKSHMLN